jgi:serine-type D-Ala-D-Ala carboxypeptidase (penicillin-binding protein 5/6)
MNIRNLLRLLTAVIFLVLSLASFAANQNIIAMPKPPELDVKAYLVIDANSGYVIAEKNADEHLPPASLTKLMSLYLAANALRMGQIHFQDQVTISENAWRKGGSRMFIRVGSQVRMQDLLDGIVTASGNDATVAVAEYLAGTEDNFVKQMNDVAVKLGMHDTHFADSNGLPEPQHYSTARDLGTLARAWILTFPEYYPWFKEKWFVFNGIKQPNRNRLLWRDPSVDGMKTGHTDEAMYCLIVSAVRNNMRLITVVLGAPSDSARTEDSEALLNYGFRYYETRRLFAANSQLPIAPAKVWFAKESKMQLGLSSNLFVTAPIGELQNLRANAKIDKDLTAPIKQGQACGKIEVVLRGKVIAAAPLVALHDNPRANFIFVFFDYFAYLFHQVFTWKI